MEYKDYSKLLEYIEDDKYVYIVIIRCKGLGNNEYNNKIVDTIKSMSPNKFIFADVNYRNPKHIVLQSMKEKERYNCIIIRRKYLEEAISILGMTLLDVLKNGFIYPKPTLSIKNQMARKKKRASDTLKKTNLKKEIKKKYDTDADKNFYITSNCKVDGKLKDWILGNKRKLVKNATNFEVYVAKRLIKAFGNKVKVQQPFVINGKCYYADACIKSKKIIIEVDGGYHDELAQMSRDFDRDKAFKSIGYETIRITNDEVVTKGKVTELINRIKTLFVEH